MRKFTFIYTLSDPITGDVRYVGKSDKPIQRLNQHIKNYTNSNNYKNRWIKSLISKGLEPKLEILDEVKQSEWEYWEKYWITQFKNWGFKLTNSTDGGDCGPTFFGDENPSKRPEVRKKISEANKGRKVSEETKEKLSKYRGENHHGFGKLAWNSGVKYSEKLKNKLSELQRGENNNFYGKKHSEKTKEKLRLINTGKILSEEHKRKISKSGTGKHRGQKSEEHKKKISQAKSKPILQFDLDGNFLKEWSSAIEASKKYGSRVGISNCCLEKVKTSRGYIWKFKNKK